MESLLYSLVAGVSTSAGVVVLLIFGSPGKKTLAALLGFAGGIMIAVSVFELMPESVSFGSMPTALVGLVLGAGVMYLLDRIIPHSHMSESDHLVVENPHSLDHVKKPMLRIGYFILFGIALHNLPEGLAIGAGLEISPEIGLVIAGAIALHNIPEGLAMAGPLKAGGLASYKVLLFTLMAGLMTPIGTAIGLLIFQISPVFIGGSLAFAAGAMLYIVNDELIPQANAMNSHLANAGLLLGVMLGFAFL